MPQTHVKVQYCSAYSEIPVMNLLGASNVEVDRVLGKQQLSHILCIPEIHILWLRSHEDFPKTGFYRKQTYIIGESLNLCSAFLRIVPPSTSASF